MRHNFLLGVFFIFSFFKITVSHTAETNSENFWTKAERGDAAAQYEMARNCPTILVETFAHVPDYKCIVPWLEKSAAQGNPDAQLRLSQLYAEGNGVKQDHGKAQELGKSALTKYYIRANQGDAYSMRQLSMLSPNPVEKVKWLEKAAQAGDVRSMMYIAKLYAEGDGVEKNFSLVDSWVQKIAEKKDRVREFQLDIFGMYSSHLEDENNRINAYIWASKLPNHFLDSVLSRLTPEEIEKAKQHVRASTFPVRLSEQK